MHWRAWLRHTVAGRVLYGGEMGCGPALRRDTRCGRPGLAPEPRAVEWGCARPLRGAAWSFCSEVVCIRLYYHPTLQLYIVC